MVYGDRTKPTSVEVCLADRLPGYRYGIVLALLAITYIVMAAEPPDPWTRVLTVFLQGATLLAAFVVSRVNWRLFRVAAVAAGLSLLTAIGSVVASSSTQPTTSSSS